MPPNINLDKPSTNNNEHLDANEYDRTDTNAATARKVCRACGTPGVNNRCGACKRVFFCDRECQKQIWVAHRPECARLIADAPSRQDDANVGESNSNEVGTSIETPNTASPVVSLTTREEEETNETASSQSTDCLLSTPSMSPPKAKKAVVLIPEPDVIPVVELPVLPEEEPAMKLPSAVVTPKSSKKKKNKKKKARSNSLHAPVSAPMPQSKLKSRSQSLSVKKHVVWGDVLAREFTRFPGGGGAIPYDGSWALGLGSPVADVQLGSVMEVEELRLSELEARAKDLTKSQRARVREGETRQFDYKSGARNPLFGRLSERERRKIFSKIEAVHLHELEEQVSHRKRSVSCETSAIRVEEDAPPEADFACVASEQLNEFLAIRDSRDDTCGCSCGDLLKKVVKMNVKKLQAFLNVRKVRIAGHSKPELLAQAKAVALREKNCSNSSDCECARNGVGCHANVCVGCVGDCYNPHSQYAYQKDVVVRYRKQQIARWNDEHAEGMASLETHHQGRHSISVA